MSHSDGNSFFVADTLPGNSSDFTPAELIHSADDGFTDIYRASRHGRIFVLKALKPRYALSPLHRSLLRKEYELSIGLVHPAIAMVYSFETVAELGDCIIEEWIDGTALDIFIARNNPQPLDGGALGPRKILRLPRLGPFLLCTPLRLRFSGDEARDPRLAPLRRHPATHMGPPTAVSACAMPAETILR